ncbi:MAG: PIG-L family deacetylase [Gluconacetobacter diazotrophicus]|nr:PIG-L family deacetylase [Gluconacetobacter diazotrophicus]
MCWATPRPPRSIPPSPATRAATATPRTCCDPAAVTRLAVLALSPHLDDAAFSAGFLLHRLSAAGHRVTVATLFTRSVPHPAGFALACQTDKGLSPDLDYMALRRDEDRAASAALGAAPHWCDLPEAPHRGYGSAPALFEPPHPADDAAIAPVLDETLSVLLADHLPDLVLAPQAIGAHVDHVQLVRALCRIPDPPPILWWRDFPYVSREACPREPFAELFRSLPERAAAVTADPGTDPAATPKRRACAAYRSQLGFQFGGEAGLDRALRAAGPREWFRVSPVPLPRALEPILDPVPAAA